MSFVNAPIHDLLIRIKNAYMARRHTVENVVHSKFKAQVLDLLQRFKFIKSYEVKEENNKKTISIVLHTT
jgi:ribosomal protein S8